MSRKVSSISSLNKPDAYKPAIRFGFRLPANRNAAYTEILPFKKYWLVIGIVSIFLIAFSLPLFAMNISFADMDDLFDLTTNLFQLFWALGWSTGILFLVLALIALLFAREILIVEPEKITLRIEILNFGFETSCLLNYIHHLRYVTDGTVTGAQWRGNHLTFDYLHIPISFGSNLDLAKARDLIRNITATLHHPVPVRLSTEIESILEKQQPLPHLIPAMLVEKLVSAPQKKSRLAADHSAIASDKLSISLLLIANLVPLLGVIFAGWNVADIMLLFWLESGIIGFFNILKMFYLSGPLAIFSSIFFIGHFGGFMAVHLMFIFALFVEGDGATATLPEVLAIFHTLWIGIVALFISHAFSFKHNFINKKEYEKLSIKDQMHKPYSRIMMMHLTLILGGFLVMVLDSRFLALALLIGMKVAVDIRAHIKEHQH